MKKIITKVLVFTFVVAISLVGGSNTNRVLAAASSEYTLNYQDNFDGTSLNTNDWFYRQSGLYAGGYNRKENVSVSGGNLHIAFKKEDFNNDTLMEYTGGGIISTQNFGYGYYEVRCKLLGGVNGFHQSFWQMGLPYGDVTSPGYDTLVDSGLMPYYGRTVEIDGFEQNSNNSGYAATNFHKYLPTHTNVGGVGYGVDTTQWFTMGYEYLPGQIKYYCNGTLVRTVSYDNIYGQSNFWLSCLANSVHSGALGSVPEGSEALFDYFKFYTKSSPGINRITNDSFEYNNASMNVQYPMGWLENYDTSSSSVVNKTGHTGSYFLKHQNASSSYLVTTKQNVENIPNGTYKLTAWVRSSGGQSQAVMRVLGYGGTDVNFNIPASSIWKQITIGNINVTNGKAIIAFTSNAAANQWIEVDDVVFAENSLPSTTYECESLTTTNSSGDSNTDYSDAGASGGAFNNLNANAVNDYVEYIVNVAEIGTYTVNVSDRAAINKGIYQLAIDGTNLGLTKDEYNSTTVFRKSNIGNVTFSTTGNKLFRFKVTGKNASSTGYQLGLDNITLVKN